MTTVLSQLLPRPENPVAFRQVIDSVAEYLQANEFRFLRDREPVFDAERVTQTLVFHALLGNLAVAWVNGRIAGVAIAWQTDAEWIRLCEAEDRAVFDWKPTDPEGDSVYLALVVTTEPSAMQPLANYFLERFPRWRALPMFAHRRGQLRSVTGLLERLTHG